MKKLMAAAALSMITATSTAGAVEYPYIGLDYLNLDLGSEGFAREASPEAARLRFGAVVHKFVALEAHVIGGTADDTVVSGPIAFDVSVDGIYSLNAALRLPLGEVGSIYAYGGYGVARLSREAPGVPGATEFNVDDDGLNYGATIEFRVWKDWGLEVDYTTYLDNDVNELTAVGVGIRRRL